MKLCRVIVVCDVLTGHGEGRDSYPLPEPQNCRVLLCDVANSLAMCLSYSIYL
jgi:hypothetical protein